MVPTEARDLSILHNVEWALTLTQPLTKWVPRPVSPEEKRRGRETDNSPPSSAEVKNFGAIYTIPDKFTGFSA
jgi:hypothetical protein